VSELPEAAGEELDPGPPLPELADYGLPTSPAFVEEVRSRINRRDTAVQSAELPVAGLTEVVRAYFLFFLDLFSPSPPRE
jgi:hypothetical protein